MELEYEVQNENRAEVHDDEQLESSTTDDLGTSQYYPNVDFFNPHSVRKRKSRLGKRLTRQNPIRFFAVDQDDDVNNADASKNSAEDSCSDISRDIVACPFTDKIDFLSKKAKNTDQGGILPSSSHQSNERQGFRDLSNSVKNISVKPLSQFSQDNAFSADSNRVDNITEDANQFSVSKHEPNAVFSNSRGSNFKTPLKQSLDNIFVGSASKTNCNNKLQSNSAKTLFYGSSNADSLKENLPNPLSLSKTTSKAYGLFSNMSTENNNGNLLNKNDPPNFIRNKTAEHKNVNKFTSFEDLPLDLKMKFKVDKTSNKSSSAIPTYKDGKIKSTDSFKKSSDVNYLQKYTLNINSKGFINILDMPSVKNRQNHPSDNKYNASPVSCNSPDDHSPTNDIIDQFKKPSAPPKEKQFNDLSPQTSDSAYNSVLNLSTDQSCKRSVYSNDANNSIYETKASQLNQMNVTDINTASFIPNYNSSFLLSSENIKKSPQNDPLSTSSESEKSSCSLLKSSFKQNSDEAQKIENSTNRHTMKEVDLSNQEKIPVCQNAPSSINFLSTFNPKAVLKSDPASSVSSSNHQPENAHSNNISSTEKNANDDLIKNQNSVDLKKGAQTSTGHSDFHNFAGQKNPFVNSVKNTSDNPSSQKNMFEVCKKENMNNCEFKTSVDSIKQEIVDVKKCVLNSKTKPEISTLMSEPQESLKNSAKSDIASKIIGPEIFKVPAQPTSNARSRSPVPIVNINSNFVLPKVNTRTSKPTYSFASEVAKYCQNTGRDVKLNSVNNSQPQKNTSTISINNKFYQVLSILGRGGSSEVYQVLDTSSKTLMAVKCVKLSSVDESIAEGYKNEVELLEQLQGCSSVIKMFDYEYLPHSKKLFVVMEKGDTDLSRLLKDINKTKKVSMSMIIYYWTEMLTAVQEIHEKGIIHSDLKPANFLLVSGRLKLIDFGIASSLQGDMTSIHKDICAGTENYMSPEAIQDGTGSNDKKFKISYKSDVWSLGCILYNLLYGKTPFSHITNRWGKMYAIINSSHKIEFPDSPMPPILRSALQSCLIRDPKQRPTVKELLDLPYHSVALPKELPFKIQQILPQEWWEKISHLFSENSEESARKNNQNV